MTSSKAHPTCLSGKGFNDPIPKSWGKRSNGPIPKSWGEGSQVNHHRSGQLLTLMQNGHEKADQELSELYEDSTHSFSLLATSFSSRHAKQLRGELSGEEGQHTRMRIQASTLLFCTTAQQHAFAIFETTLGEHRHCLHAVLCEYEGSGHLQEGGRWGWACRAL